MYQWWVFLHIVGVAGFLLAHGVSTGVALKLRKERDRKRIGALLELSGSSIKLFYVSLFLLLSGGIIAGFVGQHWSRKWIWISLILLVVVMALMYGLASPYYRRLNRAVQIRPSGNPTASDEELEHLLTSTRSLWVSFIGFAGLLAILYLMVFKPL